MKVQLTFKDEIRLMYRTGHRLGNTVNHDSIFSGPTLDKESDKLKSRVGYTENQIKVIYSMKTEVILK